MSGNTDISFSLYASNTDISFSLYASNDISDVSFNQPYYLSCDTSSNLYCANYNDNNILIFNSVDPSGKIFHTLTSSPYGLVNDKQGNLYVSQDACNNIIKISPDGSNSSIFLESLSAPHGLAFDASGYLYCANYYGPNIVKIDTNSNPIVVTTFASSSVTTITDTSFGNPNGLAFDANGYLYCSQTFPSSPSNIIRISPDGLNASKFYLGDTNTPNQLAFDLYGYLYCASTGNNDILRITPDGYSSSTINTQKTGGFPYGLTIDKNEYLYFSESGFNSILKSKIINDISLNTPYYLSCDTSNNLYVANKSSNDILIYNSIYPSGKRFHTLNSSPYGLVNDKQGNLYVSQDACNNIIKISPDGSNSSIFLESLSAPHGLAFDASGYLYCANYYGPNIVKIDTNSNPIVVTTFASSSVTTITDTSFGNPNGLAFDASGYLYCSQTLLIGGTTPSSNIIRISPDGLNASLFYPGTTNIQTSNPNQLAFDSNGYLYCASTGNNDILRITPNGSNSSILNNNLVGNVYPYGLAIDTNEYLYYSETGANYIFKSNEPVCFNHDTKILCLNHLLQDEYIPIQDLKKGDLVKTYLHGYRKIEYMYQSRMINNPNQWKQCMYKMEKTEENELLEDLIVTGGHAIMVDSISEVEQERYNKLGLSNFAKENKVDEKYLLLASVSEQFIPLTDTNIYTIYHFCLENNGDDTTRYGVWANGILTETPSKQYLVEQR